MSINTYFSFATHKHSFHIKKIHTQKVISTISKRIPKSIRTFLSSFPLKQPFCPYQCSKHHPIPQMPVVKHKFTKTSAHTQTQYPHTKKHPHKHNIRTHTLLSGTTFLFSLQRFKHGLKVSNPLNQP